MAQEFNGIRCSSIAIPRIPVGHPNYVWRGSADTDVQRTWRNYGWKPAQIELAYTTQVRATAQAMRAVR
jgi:hypothetical protein